MALQDHYNPAHIFIRLAEIWNEGSFADHRDEIRCFQYWLNIDKFDRRTVNHRLHLYAAGDERWRERRL